LDANDQVWRSASQYPGRHLIFYVVERDRIVIVRVIDGRMDIDEEFKR